MLVPSATAILIFFFLHWWGSVFMQTFYLHRYASHGMFRMSKVWERFFHLMTWLLQGSSFLQPRAYAYLHRAHHAYSDTEKDPHSPHFYPDAGSMMWQTKIAYGDLVRGGQPEPRFRGYTPYWPAIDGLGDTWASRIGFGTAYTLFYIAFAPHWAFFLLLPIHYLMGPIHGAIVNWGGHKYGYRNFDTRDMSRNVLPWDLVTLGELFQNNHHRHGQSPKFAQRAFELDPTYPVMRLMHAVGIIDMDRRPEGLRPDSDELAEVPEAELAPAE
jgi:stearoyl-CoA desaturase (delta-9 desaturase)